MEDYCRQLPKVELHAHLNGSINNETIGKLVARHAELGWAETSPLPNDWQVVIEKGSTRSLDEGFLIFKLIHQLTRDEEAIRMVTQSVVQDFADDNCRYLELRSTPRAVPDTGMTKESYVAAILHAIQESESEQSNSKCIVRVILSIDRRQSVAEAMDTVLLAQRHMQQSGLVLGIDLSGDPKVPVS
ncbi:adenosine deaminase-like protein [Sycon ciliatum]|uniref:adenosine deaminase-like protein n=1 Tax=Sycon ciliatum TaxID=27933 RepID=UPI0031F718EA